jgi:soluble lytic murein transglycosylase-like protein
VRLVRFATFALVLACIAAPAAHAEYAILSSGARLHITGYEVIGGSLRLHVSGGTVDVPAEEVIRIEPEEVFAPVAVSTPKEGPLRVPYADLIRAAAEKYELDPQLVAGVVRAESNFNPRAVSTKNAQGLMQLMPGTSAQLALHHPFDPAENIDAGARYLRQLLDQFSGDVPLALAAYNAGPMRVTQYGGVPPYRETRDYIQRITKLLDRSKSRQPLDAAAIAALFDKDKNPR